MSAIASDYDVELSLDGKEWTRARRVAGGNGGRDYLQIPNANARFIRLNFAGKREIRAWWKKSKAFLPTTHWISDTPAYKVRATANGDRGTLTFECHFIDVDTGNVAAVTGGDFDVARVDGRWLITRMVGSTAQLVI